MDRRIPMIRPVRSFDTCTFVKTCVLDRLFHRQVVIGSALAHETHDLAVDHFLDVDVRAAFDMAAETHIGVFLREGNAGFSVLQGLCDFILVVADAGDNTRPVTTTRFILLSLVIVNF
jgi:hypothetical protein